MELNLDKRYQTLLILWGALLMSLGTLFLVTVIAAPPVLDENISKGKSLLVALFTAVGTFIVGLSFVVKRKLLVRSVETQNIDLVQKALIVACAMCEAAAMLALMEYFVVGSREYYLLFIIAAIGTTLHFPKRDQLLAASYKKEIE